MRLMRDNRRRHHSGWRTQRRRRSGFGMFGPFPSYSRRTRRGSRVTVTGCCLPIPLTLTLGAAMGARRAFRSR